MKALTTNQIADICGVDRTTVGYWIRNGRIQAQRSGKKYLIPVNDLRLFLESIGQEIPAELSREDSQCLDFPTTQTCWEFSEINRVKDRCKECIVFKNRIQPCFAFYGDDSTRCAGTCIDCAYYRKYYFPKIRLIYQIDMPAAVFKDLYIWGANHPFEALYGFKTGHAIGVGTERIVHPDSLEKAICYGKRRALGDQTIPKYYDAELRIRGKEKIAAHLFVSTLIEPEGSILVIFDPFSIE